MLRKVLRIGILAAVTGAIVAGWPDIKRFIRIRQVSAGGPRPGKVPAGGRTVYPQRTQDSQPDGTGDFDSALRGGPASA